MHSVRSLSIPPLPGLQANLWQGDPACPKPGGIGSEHQILHRKRAVLDRPVAWLPGRDDNQDGRVVEDLEIWILQLLPCDP
jgi:hypothetical protein